MTASWLSDPFIVRNLTYGIEDSLISTTGVLVGVASAGFSLPAILMTGGILIFVEASSMAFGAFMADESFLITAKTAYTISQVLFYAAVMFMSYALAGIIPMIPFVLKWKHAIPASVVLAMTALFLLALWIQKDVAKALLLTAIGTAIMFASIAAGRYAEQYAEPYASKFDKRGLKN
jgi:VIT1/CCC1 family predicted Fe2+/Mn2+ transporter